VRSPGEAPSIWASIHPRLLELIRAHQSTLLFVNSRRLAERLAAVKANQVKRELSELQAKVEFQALMVQFLMQRRFQHVLLSTRFYRALFTDGDTKLNVGKDTKDLFEKSAGMPPTQSSPSRGH